MNCSFGSWHAGKEWITGGVRPRGENCFGEGAAWFQTTLIVLPSFWRTQHRRGRRRGLDWVKHYECVLFRITVYQQTACCTPHTSLSPPLEHCFWSSYSAILLLNCTYSEIVNCRPADPDAAGFDDTLTDKRFDPDARDALKRAGESESSFDPDKAGFCLAVAVNRALTRMLRV